MNRLSLLHQSPCQHLLPTDQMQLQPIHLPMERTRGLCARGGMWHLFTRNGVCARQEEDCGVEQEDLGRGVIKNAELRIKN